MVRDSAVAVLAIWRPWREGEAGAAAPVA